MMTINLPNDLEKSILAAVKYGRFASVDEAMTKAVRLLLNRPEPRQLSDEERAFNDGMGPIGSMPDDGDPGFFGSLREDADLLDQVVALAMKDREAERRRPSGE